MQLELQQNPLKLYVNHKSINIFSRLSRYLIIEILAFVDFSSLYQLNQVDKFLNKLLSQDDNLVQQVLQRWLQRNNIQLKNLQPIKNVFRFAQALIKSLGKFYFPEETNSLPLQDQQTLILQGIYASTTDNDQSIYNTLNYRDQHKFWSSTGTQGPDDRVEYLLFRTQQNAAIATQITITFYYANYLQQKLYTSKSIRVELGLIADQYIHSQDFTIDLNQLNDKNQQIEIKISNIIIFQYMKISFIGKIGIQETDNKYYIAVESVRCYGIDFDFNQLEPKIKQNYIKNLIKEAFDNYLEITLNGGKQIISQEIQSQLPINEEPNPQQQQQQMMMQEEEEKKQDMSLVQPLQKKLQTKYFFDKDVLEDNIYKKFKQLDLTVPNTLKNFFLQNYEASTCQDLMIEVFSAANLRNEYLQQVINEERVCCFEFESIAILAHTINYDQIVWLLKTNKLDEICYQNDDEKIEQNIYISTTYSNTLRQNIKNIKLFREDYKQFIQGVRILYVSKRALEFVYNKMVVTEMQLANRDYVVEQILLKFNMKPFENAFLMFSSQFQEYAATIIYFILIYSFCKMKNSPPNQQDQQQQQQSNSDNNSQPSNQQQQDEEKANADAEQEQEEQFEYEQADEEADADIDSDK